MCHYITKLSNKKNLPSSKSFKDKNVPPIQIDDDLAFKTCQNKHIKSKAKSGKTRKDSGSTHSSKSTTTISTFTEEEGEEGFKITLTPVNANANNMPTDHIIDNLNSGEGCLNNPKSLERIEKAYKYLKNLVHKLKLPRLNNYDDDNDNDYSFNGCYELLYYKESAYYETSMVSGCKQYMSSSKLDFNIKKYESLSNVIESDNGIVNEIAENEFCIKLLPCQWDNNSYYSDLNESEGYDSDELSIFTDDE
jgi:hypothetical protein